MVIYLPASSRYPPDTLPYREGTVAFEKKSFPGKLFFSNGSVPGECREEAGCSGQKSPVLLTSSSRQIGKFSSRSREEDGRRTGGFFDQGIRQDSSKEIAFI